MYNDIGSFFLNSFEDEDPFPCLDPEIELLIIDKLVNKFIGDPNEPPPNEEEEE